MFKYINKLLLDTIAIISELTSNKITTRTYTKDTDCILMKV